jgi:hypothetical protein
MTVFILNKMQKFDQQIRATFGIPQQRLNIDQGLILILAPLWCVTAFAFARLPNTFAII